MSNLETLKARLIKRAETRKAYKACHPQHIAYNLPGTGWSPPDERGNRWAETLAGAGLRYVGASHEIIRTDNLGYYTDASFEDTYSPVVLQIPAREGAPVYLAAYKTSYGEGFRVMGRKGALYLFHDKSDAAHSADDFAAKEAEKERDYQEAYAMGAKYADLGATIKTTRKDALALIREIKDAGKSFAPGICATLRGELHSMRRTIEKARAERATMLDVNAWWEKKYGPVFNEAAGETVFGGV